MGFEEELHGRRAPASLQQFVTDFGGTNHNGVPNYRLVWAPSVRHKAYGAFTDWDDYLEPSERGGLVQNDDGTFAQTSQRAIRTVEEMRWLETYPYDEGWILEKWYPRHMFGPPEVWKRAPLLGPYPEYGRYVDCCNPIKHLPTVGQIENLIQAIENKIANKQGTMNQRIAKRYKKIVAAAEERKRQAREQMKAQLHERTSVIFGSSLAAGRIREQLAAQVRAKGGQIGHVGN